MERRKTGRIGEDAVAAYLIRNGHTILQQNWRSGHLEVDIISLDERGLHFVEIKTRHGGELTSPEEKVGLAKQKRIIKAANSYLHKLENTKTGGLEVFFDVAAVKIDGGNIEIKYFPEAYIPLSY